MGLVVANPWLHQLLDNDRGQFNGGSLTLRLYQNNHTPDPSDALAAFTECTFSGYVPVVLGSGEFAAAVQIANGQWELVGGLHTFTSTDVSAQTVYGYFISNSTDLAWAELFASPVVLINGGPSLDLTLHYDRWARSVLPP